MSLSSTYHCNFCEATRNASNHWWLVRVDSGVLVIVPWDDDLAHRDSFAHACGRACVLRATERFMETGKLEEA